MGGERTRAGKHVFFFRACCLIGICCLFGCVFPYKHGRRSVIPAQGAEGLRWGKAFCEQKDYSASLTEAERIYAIYPEEAGDRALFQMGLIRLCPSNPHQDMKGAMDAFDRVVKEFPESPLGSEALVMADMLRKLLDRDKKMETLDRKNKDLGKRLSMEKKAAESLKAQVETFRIQAEELREQLTKMKEIDLVLEEKKNQVK